MRKKDKSVESVIFIIIFFIGIAVYIIKALFFVIGYFLQKYVDYKNRKKYSNVSEELEIIDSLNGMEFEHYMAELLEKIGHKNIEVTSGSGDFGADILSKYQNKKYAVQCKRFNGVVGNKAVQEVVAAKVYYNTDCSLVITNSKFTKNAIITADKSNVELWDRNKLIDILNIVVEIDKKMIDENQVKKQKDVKITKEIDNQEINILPRRMDKYK